MDKAKMIERLAWFERHKSIIEDESLKPIEIQSLGQWIDVDGRGYHVMNESNEYRFKPAPTIRPYNREECEALVGSSVRQKPGYGKRCTAIIDTDVVATSEGPVFKIYVAEKWITPDQLLKEWDNRDGSPCGVKVEGE